MVLLVEKEKREMSEEKINLNSQVMRSRVKKYDTYQQRGTGRTRAATLLQPVVTTINTDVSLRPTISTKTTSEKYQSLNTDESNKQLLSSNNHDIKQKPTIQNVSRLSSQSRQKVQSRQPKSEPLALSAVTKSQLYDNEIYPDNDTTLYGIAKSKMSFLQKTMYGFGVLVIIFSALVSVQSFINNNEAKEQIATLGETAVKDDQGVPEGTGREPNEEEVSQSVIGSYNVSNPLDPKIVRIPEIGVIARVKNLGVTNDGAVDSPKNINDAGWYNGSARPGNSVGSSLILGHVSGWTAPGVFKNINRLVPGSQFEVEKGNGEIVRYSVTKSEQLPLDQVDMSKILGTEIAGEHDMKLMTCSGRYNTETRGFDDRFIVYAQQIN